MNDTRVFAFRLPTGEIQRETRRRDQDDPAYAVLSSSKDTSWALYRMTQNAEEVLRCVKELLAKGQDALVTKPWAATDEDNE